MSDLHVIILRCRHFLTFLTECCLPCRQLCITRSCVILIFAYCRIVFCTRLSFPFNFYFCVLLSSFQTPRDSLPPRPYHPQYHNHVCLPATALPAAGSVGRYNLLILASRLYPSCALWLSNPKAVVLPTFTAVWHSYGMPFNVCPCRFPYSCLTFVSKHSTPPHY